MACIPPNPRRVGYIDPIHGPLDGPLDMDTQAKKWRRVGKVSDLARKG